MLVSQLEQFIITYYNHSSSLSLLVDIVPSLSHPLSSHQTGIVRCKRCRTYINPYVTWTDNGRRWRCNICGMLNDVPSSYFSHLDANGQRRDRDQRPELAKASVEFIAPGDYMVRTMNLLRQSTLLAIIFDPILSTQTINLHYHQSTPSTHHS